MPDQPTKSSPCDCPGPGFCPRFGRRMVGRQYELCCDTTEEGERYRELWARIAEPGYEAPAPSETVSRTPRSVEQRRLLERKKRKIVRPPSMMKRAWNLTKSVGEFVGDGLKTASRELYTARLEVCDSCEMRRNTTCLKCGCHLHLKARGRAFRCPLGKWPSAEQVAAKTDQPEIAEPQKPESDAESAGAVSQVAPQPQRPVAVHRYPSVFTRFNTGSEGVPQDLDGLFAGASAFLICAGPSLKELDLSLLKQRGILSMGINNVAATTVRPELWVCGDALGSFADSIWRDPAIMKFLPFNRREETIRVRNKSGQLVETSEKGSAFPNTYCYRKTQRCAVTRWLTEDGCSWTTGDGKRSTMLVALKILYILGIRQVFILGADFQMRNGINNYAFQQDKCPKGVRSNNAIFDSLNRWYSALQPHFLHAGFQVWNCTSPSGLTAFPKMSYEDALVAARAGLPESVVTDGMYGYRAPPSHTTTRVRRPRPGQHPRSERRSRPLASRRRRSRGAERGRRSQKRPRRKQSIPPMLPPLSDGVTVITPTGDRPEAFALCERYMMRQTFLESERPWQWIVVDDGVEPTECTQNQDYIRRKPGRRESSLGQNLLAALEQARHDRILIVEDDDWYSSRYVERMAELLNEGELCGERQSRYYHVAERRWRQMPNQNHASLCQTAFRRSILPQVQQACRRRSPFIDLQLWRLPVRRHLVDSEGLVLGIKGMPGRSGYGVGHNPGRVYVPDPELVQLTEWIGEEDAAVYAEMFQVTCAG